MERHIAAILAADVVGYSRLIEVDEAGTLAVLKARRHDVLKPLVAKHRGRVFKVTGDGVLVEFASPVNAVQCAVDLQQGMSAANSDQPEDRHIILRIGVNLGDVMVEGGDLYGEGVNIAARLETIAEPGAIVISGTAYDQVKNKVKVAFDDLGAQNLKNIAEPVRAYRVTGTPVVTITPPKATTDKPSIAVLPFTNMSGDAEQQYFSDGITEDIITELSRFRSLFVIARNSSFQFRNRVIDMKRIGRELGVQYLVEGSIRRSGERLRVTAQLVEADTGNQIWAERYDRDAHDIFAVQDELAHAVAATVGGRIDMAGRERSARLSPAGLKAYDLHLRAKACYLTFTKSGNEQARILAQEAMAIDPMNALIKAYYSQYCYMDYNFDWVADLDRALKTALEFAKQAVTLDDADSTARWILSLAHLLMRNYEDARVHIEKAIELNANDTEARAVYGLFLTWIGEPEKALEQFEIAKRHNPFDISWLPWVKGIAYFTARRYGEAIDSFNQIHDPNHEINYWLAASYAHAGRAAEARAKLQEFLRLAERDMAHFPGQNPQQWMNYLHRPNPYMDRRDLDHLCDGLRKAGLPI